MKPSSLPPIKHCLQKAIGQLQAAGCDTPRLDAEVILAFVLERDRSWLYAHNDEVVPEWLAKQYEGLIQRRMRREPVAYIIGQREFFGLSFAVTPAVLIPRPETELLVERALQLAPKTNGLIVDIGTGSGCIAIALARHLPQVQIMATDISAAALMVARRNARRHGVVDRVMFAQCHLLAALAGPVDLLVVNPPYIAVAELARLAPEVAYYEPRLALTDADTGLSLIEQLLKEAPKIIKPAGWLLLEFGADQGDQVLDMARLHSPQAEFEVVQDLAGRDRLLLGQF